MRQVIFQSLYVDSGFSSLKHALFYFGKLLVPDDRFPFAVPKPVAGYLGRGSSPAGNVGYFDRISLIPESVEPHLEVLELEGFRERVPRPDPSEVDPRKLHELIVREATRDGNMRLYPSADLVPVLEFLRLNPEHPRAEALADQISIFMVSLLLCSVALGRGIPWVDNEYCDLPPQNWSASYESLQAH
ncbi:MAG: hypothetical protein MPN21_10370, partial [Thermoanaerobaculia bacterium]|nr:hypothetical protein [Thermoanaerobaculia bacterium]